jgi:hypothetical protein
VVKYLGHRFARIHGLGFLITSDRPVVELSCQLFGKLASLGHMGLVDLLYGTVHLLTLLGQERFIVPILRSIILFLVPAHCLRYTTRS